jgi:hypothetical protein
LTMPLGTLSIKLMAGGPGDRGDPILKGAPSKLRLGGGFRVTAAVL